MSTTTIKYRIVRDGEVYSIVCLACWETLGSRPFFSRLVSELATPHTIRHGNSLQSVDYRLD